MRKSSISWWNPINKKNISLVKSILSINIPIFIAWIRLFCEFTHHYSHYNIPLKTSKCARITICHDRTIPIGSTVLVYMLTWIPSIYPSHVSIYTSTMDPMGLKALHFSTASKWSICAAICAIEVPTLRHGGCHLHDLLGGVQGELSAMKGHSEPRKSLEIWKKWGDVGTSMEHLWNT